MSDPDISPEAVEQMARLGPEFEAAIFDDIESLYEDGRCRPRQHGETRMTTIAGIWAKRALRAEAENARLTAENEALRAELAAIKSGIARINSKLEVASMEKPE